MNICVAVPTYGREEVLLSSIEGLFSQERLPDEIIVVDQTEKHLPETEIRLKKWHEVGKIRLIKQRLPNLPAARNKALYSTVCEIIIFIDDDVILDKNFVS